MTHLIFFLRSLRSFFTYFYILRFTLINSIINLSVAYINHYSFFTSIIMVISTYCLFKLFQINKYLFLFFSFVYSLFFFIIFYLEYILKIQITSEFLVSLFNHNQSLKQLYLNIKSLVLFILFLFMWIFSVLPLLYSKKYFKKITGTSIAFYSHKRFIIAIFLFFLFIRFPTIYSIIFGSKMNQIYPHQTAYQLKHYFTKMRPFLSKKNNRYTLESKFDYQNPRKPLTIVIYVGETARGDHFSINAYPRETSGDLKQLGVTNFGLTYPCSNLTVKSIPCMLTNYEYVTDENFIDMLMQKGFLELLEKFNFETGFIGVNDAKPLNSYLSESVKRNIVFTSSSNSLVSSYKTKGILEGDIDKGFEQYMTHFYKKNKNQVILVRNMGSHVPYESSYPPQFGKFAPICSVKDINCAKEDLINAYDNTIVYTSYLISYIIKNLKKLNSDVLFIFTSDHGESLGEKKTYFHPNNSRANFNVPFFVWVSSSFKKNYSKEYMNLINNASRSYNRMAHYPIWHSVLDIAGLSNKKGFSYLDYSKSMFRKEFKIPLENGWLESENYENLLIENKIN